MAQLCLISILVVNDLLTPLTNILRQMVAIMVNRHVIDAGLRSFDFFLSAFGAVNFIIIIFFCGHCMFFTA